MSTQPQEAKYSLLENFEKMEGGLERVLAPHCIGENSTLYKFHQGEITAAEATERILSAALGNYWLWALPLQYSTEDETFSVPASMADGPLDFVIFNSSERIGHQHLREDENSTMQWRHDLLHKDYRSLLEWRVIVESGDDYSDDAVSLTISYNELPEIDYKLLWILDLERGRNSLRSLYETYGFEMEKDIAYLGVRFSEPLPDAADTKDDDGYQILFFANYTDGKLESLVSLRFFREKAAIRATDVHLLRGYMGKLFSVLWPVWQNIVDKKGQRRTIKYDEYWDLDHGVKNLLADMTGFLEAYKKEPGARLMERALDIEQECDLRMKQLNLRLMELPISSVGAASGAREAAEFLKVIDGIATRLCGRHKTQPLETCFESQVEDKTAIMNGDVYDLLIEMWSEMLRNAFKHSPKRISLDDKISIKIEHTDGFLMTHVRNPVAADAPPYHPKSGSVERLREKLRGKFATGDHWWSYPTTFQVQALRGDATTPSAFCQWTIGIRPTWSK